MKHVIEQIFGDNKWNGRESIGHIVNTTKVEAEFTTSSASLSTVIDKFHQIWKRENRPNYIKLIIISWGLWVPSYFDEFLTLQLGSTIWFIQFTWNETAQDSEPLFSTPPTNRHFLQVLVLQLCRPPQPSPRGHTMNSQERRGHSHPLSCHLRTETLWGPF